MLLAPSTINILEIVVTRCYVGKTWSTLLIDILRFCDQLFYIWQISNGRITIIKSFLYLQWKSFLQTNLLRLSRL